MSSLGPSWSNAAQRQDEIDRFKKWYIAMNYSTPQGFRYNTPIDWDDVNEAIQSFLKHGFRYHKYPYSN